MLVVRTMGRFDGAYSKFLAVTNRLPRCFTKGLVTGGGVWIFTAFVKSKLSTRYDPLCANADSADSKIMESVRGKFFIRGNSGDDFRLGQGKFGEIVSGQS